MTGFELDNFYALDKEEYILENNKEFLEWYNSKLEQGFHPILDLKRMQKLINKIVMFFEFKYHDIMLRDLIYSSFNNKLEKSNSKEIAKKLDVQELKYRLHHDYIQFLECNYPRYVTLSRKEKRLWNLNVLYIRSDEDGVIRRWDLTQIKEEEFLDNISKVKTVEDLLFRFRDIDTKIDYSDLEKVYFYHQTNIELRNIIFSLVPLALLYSNNTLPEYGYVRAKSFIRMFNQEYNLNLDMNRINGIMSIDYSKDRLEVKSKLNILCKKKMKKPIV